MMIDSFDTIAAESTMAASGRAVDSACLAVFDADLSLSHLEFAGERDERVGRGSVPGLGHRVQVARQDAWGKESCQHAWIASRTFVHTWVPQRRRHHCAKAHTQKIPKDDDGRLASCSGTSASQTIPPDPDTRRTKPQPAKSEQQDDARQEREDVVSAGEEPARAEEFCVLQRVL